jgi:hypothetical protein
LEENYGISFAPSPKALKRHPVTWNNMEEPQWRFLDTWKKRAEKWKKKIST